MVIFLYLVSNGEGAFLLHITGGQEKILVGSRWEAATETCNLKASMKLFLCLWEHASTSSWKSLLKMMYFHARQMFIFHFLLICPEVSHQCICPAYFSYMAFWHSLQNSKKKNLTWNVAYLQKHFYKTFFLSIKKYIFYFPKQFLKFSFKISKRHLCK